MGILFSVSPTEKSNDNEFDKSYYRYIYDS